MKNKIYHFIARCLPKRLLYWSTITVIAKATTGEYSNQIVSELTAMDVLKRWEV